MAATHTQAIKQAINKFKFNEFVHVASRFSKFIVLNRYTSMLAG